MEPSHLFEHQRKTRATVHRLCAPFCAATTTAFERVFTDEYAAQMRRRLDRKASKRFTDDDATAAALAAVPKKLPLLSVSAETPHGYIAARSFVTQPGVLRPVTLQMHAHPALSAQKFIVHPEERGWIERLTNEMTQLYQRDLGMSDVASVVIVGDMRDARHLRGHTRRSRYAGDHAWLVSARLAGDELPSKIREAVTVGGMLSKFQKKRPKKAGEVAGLIGPLRRRSADMVKRIATVRKAIRATDDVDSDKIMASDDFASALKIATYLAETDLPELKEIATTITKSTRGDKAERKEAQTILDERTEEVTAVTTEINQLAELAKRKPVGERMWPRRWRWPRRVRSGAASPRVHYYREGASTLHAPLVQTLTTDECNGSLYMAFSDEALARALAADDPPHVWAVPYDHKGSAVEMNDARHLASMLPQDKRHGSLVGTRFFRPGYYYPAANEALPPHDSHVLMYMRAAEEVHAKAIGSRAGSSVVARRRWAEHFPSSPDPIAVSHTITTAQPGVPFCFPRIRIPNPSLHAADETSTPPDEMRILDSMSPAWRDQLAMQPRRPAIGAHNGGAGEPPYYPHLHPFDACDPAYNDAYPHVIDRLRRDLLFGAGDTSNPPTAPPAAIHHTSCYPQTPARHPDVIETKYHDALEERLDATYPEYVGSSHATLRMIEGALYSPLMRRAVAARLNAHCDADGTALVERHHEDRTPVLCVIEGRDLRCERIDPDIPQPWTVRPPSPAFMVSHRMMRAVTMGDGMIAAKVGYAHDRRFVDAAGRYWTLSIPPNLDEGWAGDGTEDDDDETSVWAPEPTGSSKRRARSDVVAHAVVATIIRDGGPTKGARARPDVFRRGLLVQSPRHPSFYYFFLDSSAAGV